MYEYDETVLKTFMEKQSKLLLRDEFKTLKEVDEFLSDSFAEVVNSIDDVRMYLEDSMDVFGMSDEELLAQAEVFELPDGRFLIVEG